MAIFKCKSEDRIMLVLNVLNLATNYYAGIGLKFAVKDHLTDLQGKVKTVFVDKDTLDLLNTIDAEPIKMIGRGVFYLTGAFLRIENIYYSNSNNEPGDERIAMLASEFYWELMIDNFPTDDGGSRYGQEEFCEIHDYELNLRIYIKSLIRITSCLLDVVNDGQVDLHEAYERHGIAERWRHNFITDQPHAYALRILHDLYMKLEDNLSDYYEYYDGAAEE